MTKPHESVREVIERHPDGFVGFAINIQGAAVGEGDTFCQAYADTQSAIRCHIEVFGPEMIQPLEKK